MMPDSADSTGKGTRTVSGRFCPIGGVARDVARANCHWPLRLAHSGRTNWGRGYSGHGAVVETRGVQGVESGGVFVTRPCVAMLSAEDLRESAADGAAGVTSFDGPDGAPVPTALVATTVNVYAEPLVSPLTVADRVVPLMLTTAPPGAAVTV